MAFNVRAWKQLVQNSPFDWLQPAEEELQAANLVRALVDRDGPQSAVVTVDGDQLTNFGSNDYLGLASDSRIEQAAVAAVQQYGWGSGASPLILGHSQLHRELETALAQFEQTAAALLFPTGYAANVGTLSALVDKGDAVLSDAKNHASLIDGCRLSGATIHVFSHGDVEHVARLLAETKDARRQLIVTDGLFSMDGDVAPLAELAHLAEKFAAMLMVDEAHATGVLGERGRGACEAAGICSSAALVRTGTLSKALGSLGGFVVGSKRLIRWLVNRSRPYIFSTAAPAAICSAALRALEIVATEPQRRKSLQVKSADLRSQFRAAGWQVGASQSQIIPVILGEPQKTMKFAAELKRRGLFVPGIRPPSVPVGESLLRISLTANHTPQMCDRLILSMNEIRQPSPSH